MLLGAGANVNATTNGVRQTPLHMSTQNGHVEMSQMLVGAGANVHATNKWGTPLHLSAQKGHVEVSQMLVGAGANIHATDKQGMTPLDSARATWRSRREVITLLEQVVQQQPPPPPTLPDGWVSAVDGHGNTYHFDPATGEYWTSGWVSAVDEHGNTYYFDPATGEYTPPAPSPVHHNLQPPQRYSRKGQPAYALAKAARKGNVNEVRRILAMGININTKDPLFVGDPPRPSASI